MHCASLGQVAKPLSLLYSTASFLTAFELPPPPILSWDGAFVARSTSIQNSPKERLSAQATFASLHVVRGRLQLKSKIFQGQ
jgi:hypothetical protein